jgi:hypothetical protein
MRHHSAIRSRPIELGRVTPTVDHAQVRACAQAIESTRFACFVASAKFFGPHCAVAIIENIPFIFLNYEPWP